MTDAQIIELMLGIIMMIEIIAIVRAFWVDKMNKRAGQNVVGWIDHSLSIVSERLDTISENQEKGFDYATKLAEDVEYYNEYDAKCRAFAHKNIALRMSER